MRPELDIEITARQGHRRISLHGELDHYAAPKVEKVLELLGRQGAEEVLLDLSGVTFMDSTGLRVLLRAKEICDQHGSRFAVGRRIPVRVRELLSMTEIFDGLPVS